MTRFARAHGSKAANERAPEDATSWQEMRDQLERNRREREEEENRAKFEAKRKENYQNFLKEEGAKAEVETWCSFDDESKKEVSESTSEKKRKKNEKKDEKVKRKKLKLNDEENEDSIVTKKSTSQKKKAIKNDDFVPASEELDDINSEASMVSENKAKKPKKNKNRKEIEEPADDDETASESESQNDADFNVSDEELAKWCDEYSDEEINSKFASLSSEIENVLASMKEKKSEIKKIVKKNKRKNKNEIVSVGLSEDSAMKKKSKSKTKPDDEKSENDVIAVDVPEKKKKKSSVSTKSEFHNEPAITEPGNDDNVNKKKKKKKKSSADNGLEGTHVNDELPKTNNDKSVQESNKKKKNKNPPAADNKSHKKQEVTAAKNANPGEHVRRKPLTEEKTTVYVNGEEVEVVQFGGFPILSKDADRIKDLRKNLISKGIPKSEVDRTIKLERRKAEKALARLKKKLCFHCRKAGHNLSECPELNSEADNGSSVPASGICFKCGSTEHTHFACRVVKTQDFKFAQCYICKEQGHISRQCPDNPRGMYPKGGACRECGDVTHLKKDCPKILQLREDNTIKLDTMDHNNVEDISVKSSRVKSDTPKIKQVRF